MVLLGGGTKPTSAARIRIIKGKNQRGRGASERYVIPFGHQYRRGEGEWGNRDRHIAGWGETAKLGVGTGTLSWGCRLRKEKG